MKGMGNSNRARRFSIIETSIIVVIAVCMLFLNLFTVNKLDELQHAVGEAVFIRDEVVFEDEEQFSNEIINYLEDAYKMIELYDENLGMLFQVQFNDDNPSNKDDITDHPTIVDILKRNNEGQTTVVIDGVEQDIYFKWLVDTRGETQLLMVYSSVPTVEGVWIFQLVSYIVIILVFILLLVVRMSTFHDKIKQYNRNTKRIRDELKH